MNKQILTCFRNLNWDATVRKVLKSQTTPETNWEQNHPGSRYPIITSIILSTKPPWVRIPPNNTNHTINETSLGADTSKSHQTYSQRILPRSGHLSITLTIPSTKPPSVQISPKHTYHNSNKTTLGPDTFQAHPSYSQKNHPRSSHLPSTPIILSTKPPSIQSPAKHTHHTLNITTLVPVSSQRRLSYSHLNHPRSRYLPSTPIILKTKPPSFQIPSKHTHHNYNKTTLGPDTSQAHPLCTQQFLSVNVLNLAVQYQISWPAMTRKHQRDSRHCLSPSQTG
jgi:hypothetical protein